MIDKINSNYSKIKLRECYNGHHETRTDFPMSEPGLARWEACVWTPELCHGLRDAPPLNILAFRSIIIAWTKGRSENHLITTLAYSKIVSEKCQYEIHPSVPQMSIKVCRMKPFFYRVLLQREINAFVTDRYIVIFSSCSSLICSSVILLFYHSTTQNCDKVQFQLLHATAWAKNTLWVRRAFQQQCEQQFCYSLCLLYWNQNQK